MPWIDVIWSYGPRGNVRKIKDHGLTTSDVEAVLMDPDSHGRSRSSGNPLVFGTTPDGRTICVIYEPVDAISVIPITAYEVED